MGFKIIGNFDSSNNYDPTKPGTSISIENIAIINTPFQTVKDLIINSDLTMPVISLTSNQYDRISGLQTYLYYLFNNGVWPIMVLPQSLYDTLEITDGKFMWFDYQYKNLANHDKVLLIDDISIDVSAYQQTDLYNSLKSLANTNHIYIHSDTTADTSIAYLRLTDSTCSNGILNYAVVCTYVTPDNSTKELYVIVDYKYSNKVVDFVNNISSNFTKIRIAWYTDVGNDPRSNKLTSSEQNLFGTTFASFIVNIDDNDSTKIGILL